jgi:DNA (cytosine-5)-methyltransferase 1
VRPRLLDLFCGAGGAARGYQQAGFYVVGVDVNPQPRYAGDAFVQGDALNPPIETSQFHAVHASPPCQGYTAMTNRWGSSHPRLLPEVRKLLRSTGLPYIIENVVGAPLLDPVRLCGSAFGLGTYRHRLFESNVALWSTPCYHDGPRAAIYGKLDGRRLWTRKDGSEYRASSSLAEAWAAMGVDWMEWDELREAIPPAFTEHLGTQLLSVLTSTATGT